MPENGRSVLVVEDDLDIRDMVELTLQTVGYRVTTAGEGQEALDRIAHEMPGAIVLDLKMPGMDGWQFAQEFHHRYGEGAPIMVLSASQGISQHAKQIGAASYLDKPFDTDDLIKVVERLLGLPRTAADSPAQTAISMEEALTVQQAITGDELAFQSLYAKHSKDLYRYLYYRTGNSHDAEDLVQQVFLRAWAKLGSYRQGSAPFSSWLFAIARNLSISFYRRQRYNWSLDDPAFQTEIPDQYLRNDPVHQIEMQWQHDMVREAIERLPLLHQQVLMLRFVQNLQHREIAVALNKTEGSVRVLQLRALRKLRRFLNENDGHP